MAHKALGRGLNALFATHTPSNETLLEQPIRKIDGDGVDVHEIAINSIKPNRHQPRNYFDPATLDELAQSIKLHGIAQPLIVTKTPVTDEYELVAGERRLRAAKMAGLATVPCIVKQMSNQKRFEIALIENLQREDLNALEEAIALDNLMKYYSLTQDQVASAIGKSRSTVANILRFLRLHENVQAALKSGTITEGHAKCLAGLQEHAEQLFYLEKIIKEKWTVRDLENALHEKNTKKKKEGFAERIITSTPEIKKYEETLQRTLGRRVEIQSDGKKGWIRFAFYSPWDLDMLLKKLNLFEGDPGPNPETPSTV